MLLECCHPISTACQQVALLEVEAGTMMHHNGAMNEGDSIVVDDELWESLTGGTTRTRLWNHGGGPLWDPLIFVYQKCAKLGDGTCIDQTKEMSDVNIRCPKYLAFYQNVCCFCHFTLKSHLQNHKIWPIFTKMSDVIYTKSKHDLT